MGESKAKPAGILSPEEWEAQRKPQRECTICSLPPDIASHVARIAHNGWGGRRIALWLADVCPGDTTLTRARVDRHIQERHGAA